MAGSGPFAGSPIRARSCQNTRLTRFPNRCRLWPPRAVWSPLGLKTARPGRLNKTAQHPAKLTTRPAVPSQHTPAKVGRPAIPLKQSLTRDWPVTIGRYQLAGTNWPSATIHSPLGGDPKAFSGPQLSSSAARMLTIPPRHPNPFWGPAFRPSGCRDDSLRPQQIRQILNTPGGSRTPNLWIRSPLLYPVELRVPVFSWKTIREGIGLARGIQSTGSQLFIRRCAGQNTSVPVPPTFGRSHPWALRDTTGNRTCFASGSAHCCT